MDKRHFWEYFADRKIFLGLKVRGSGSNIKKIPVGVDGNLGAAAGDETRLGTYAEAVKIADYTAISLWNTTSGDSNSWTDQQST